MLVFLKQLVATDQKALTSTTSNYTFKKATLLPPLIAATVYNEII